MIRNFFKSKVNPSIAPEVSPEVRAKEASKESLQESAKHHPNLLGADSKSRIKLGIEKHLFSRTGDSVPVLSTWSGTPFHNLEVKGKVFESNDVILEDAITGRPVAVVVRKYATTGNIFNIYSPCPAYSGQTPAKLYKYNQRLYAFAQVKPSGKLLNVVFEGVSNPTYTIHRIVPHTGRRFITAHVIKKQGEEVASTRYGAGNSFILTVEAGADPCLMICLAAIVDEVDK